MGALRAAQFEYDNRMPPAVSDRARAREIWIQDMFHQLLRGADATFQIGGETRGVTYERFAQAVDEHASPGITSPNAVGRLLLAVRRRDMGESHSVYHEVMAVPCPDSVLEQLARDLLTPFAAAGVQAQAEDAL
ncbi:hypothetical protein [Pseudomonas sp. REB1044]|uniref:hypothetical protein n=1 Tax=Pseudomonas sp. REB1044 TaxID=2675224 RepID=UPI00315DCD9E